MSNSFCREVKVLFQFIGAAGRLDEAGIEEAVSSCPRHVLSPVTSDTGSKLQSSTTSSRPSTERNHAASLLLTHLVVLAIQSSVLCDGR